MEGGVGRGALTTKDKRYRVKCNLVFDNPKVALALRGIIRAFEASVVNTNGNGTRTRVQ